MSPRELGCLAVAMLLLTSPVAVAEEIDIASMDLAELAEVEIATGRPQPLSQAPAVVTVISSDEIERMGATHLDEVLETVPGLHVGLSRLSRLGAIYSIRGIHSSTNAQVLTLIDGVPITQLLSGGRLFSFRMPVANIDRVEIIRGPGSAVYGADAFAGVINVITKTTSGTARTEFGMRAGSFGRTDAWAQYGGRHGGWDIGLSAAWQHTDGDRDRRVSRDAQTSIDEQLGTDASRAPGPLATDHEVLDLHLGLTRARWAINLWGWMAEDRGNGAGVAQALDPFGSEDGTNLLLDVTYHSGDRFDDWELAVRGNTFYVDQLADFTLFPPGAVLPIDGEGNVNFDPGTPSRPVRFTDGLRAQPGDRERTDRLETVLVYRGASAHRFRLALGGAHHELEARIRQNFGPGIIDGSEPLIDGTLTDVTGTPNTYLEDRDRDSWFLSLQDEWQLSERLDLTAGVRYDHYSDVGDTLNPRLALVWSARPDVHVKLLYGSAFRAPSFGELGTINNPANLGNPDLEPETIDTAELVLDLRPDPDWHTVFNLFAYRAEDLIDLVPDEGSTTQTTQNTRKQDGYGIELEATWRPGPSFFLRGDAAWQNATDSASGKRVAGAPSWQAGLSGHWQLRTWSVHGRLSWIGRRARIEGDPRDALGGYAFADLTFRRMSVNRRLSVALALRNLFDTTGEEPSSIAVPDDFPLPGRSAFVELRWRP